MIFDNDITRRAFLGGGIKTAAILYCAPSIVRAESLMKIWVPPEKEIITKIEPALPGTLSMSGFAPGDQVFVKNEVTGEVLINELVGTYQKDWPIDGGGGVPLNVAIRRQWGLGLGSTSYINFQHRVGSPYPGGKTKITAINTFDGIHK